MAVKDILEKLEHASNNPKELLKGYVTQGEDRKSVV